MTQVCGTGTWGTAPKPGDPDNNSILTAMPSFGGIDVMWTFPEVNPHGVAYVNLYRGTKDEVAYAVRHAVVTGDFFYDKTTSATPIEFFYWIEIVSVNGTHGELIGPASAIARPTFEQVMEGLTAQIDAGMLSQSLKQELDRIELNRLSIDEEILARAASDDALAASINELQAFTDDTRALIQEETLARAEENAAFVDHVNTLQATIEDEVMAAIQTEQSARVSADEALATAIQTAQAELGDDIATARTQLETMVGDTVGAMWTAQVNVNGMVGGFGIMNDGQQVEAGFDVDRFWVGKTDSNKRKPFIIEDGEVFIDKAAIGSISTGMLTMPDGTPVTTVDGRLRADALDIQEVARFNGDVHSSNYVPTQSGWIIRQNGFVEFNEATIRGNLEVRSITVNGEPATGGALVTTTAYNGSSRTTSTERIEINRVIDTTRTASTNIKGMPQGSRIEVTLPLPSFSVSARANGTSRWRRRIPGDGGGDYAYGTDPFVGEVATYIRVIIRVDGHVILERSVGSTSLTSAGTQSRTGGASPVSASYIYPTYMETSTISIETRVYARARRPARTTYYWFSGWETSTIEVRGSFPATLLTGNIYRLG